MAFTHHFCPSEVWKSFIWTKRSQAVGTMKEMICSTVSMPLGKVGFNPLGISQVPEEVEGSQERGLESSIPSPGRCGLETSKLV